MTGYQAHPPTIDTQYQPTHRHQFKVIRLKDDRILIESPHADGPFAEKMLVIGGSAIHVKDKKIIYPHKNNVSQQLDACGVIGLIDLCFGKYFSTKTLQSSYPGRYLLVATKRQHVATFQTHKVYKVTDGMIWAVSFDNNHIEDPSILHNMPEKDLSKYALDLEYIKDISHLLKAGFIYYSQTYDLTHSLQHNQFLTKKLPNKSKVDDRYWFNAYLQHFTTLKDCFPWKLKCILGYTGAIELPLTEPACCLLISRVNHKNLGTRYMRRGLDKVGNAANSSEMEQIIFNKSFLKDSRVCSFIQIRGSVPIIWRQEIDLSYRPKLFIEDISNKENWKSISAHFDDLLFQYPGDPSHHVTCVNLLDSGFEGTLASTFEKAVMKYKNETLQHESFSINQWCKNMDFKNMDILIARIGNRLTSSGVFFASGAVPDLKSNGSLSVHCIQKGFLRVNCLDSLDRTNLTCSMFAKFMIPHQIIKLSEKYTHQDLFNIREEFESYQSRLTNLWADSGDAISIIYAGTRALKSDVTRTGTRQLILGPLNDGLNSLTRYYLNNFSDGRKQDIYDLVTGKIDGKEIIEFSEKYGYEKAKQIKEPFISKERGVGSFLPRFLVDGMEPFFQAALDFRVTTMINSKKVTGVPSKYGHVDTSGKPQSYVGFVLSLLKSYAPERVSTVIEFSAAMIIFIYILILIKIFQIDGKLLVNKQQFPRKSDMNTLISPLD